MKRCVDNGEDSQETVVDKLYVCNFCHHPFSRDYMAVRHIRVNHWSPTQQPTESFTSLDLGKMVTRIKTARARKYRKIFTCTLCHGMMNRVAMAGHVCVTDSGNLSCVTLTPQGKVVICDDRKYLFTKRQGFLCDTCGEVFKGPCQLDTHLLRAHGQTTERNRGCVCTYCGRTCSHSSMLKEHLAICKQRVDGKAGGGKEWVCDTCGKKFKYSASMNAHRREQHTIGKKFKCEHCPKSFHKRQHWLTHTRQHFGASQFVCPLCSQQFLRNYNLKVHLRIHSGEKPYRCGCCDAAFSQQTSLTYHMRKHAVPCTVVS